MSIPMEPITVKIPPEEIPVIRKQAESQGFKGLSDYFRHLASEDRKVLRKKWVALDSIFGDSTEHFNDSAVGRGSVEDSQ